MHNKKKSFLKLPEYPGGKEAFKKYIQTNLKYPKEALIGKVEGVVHLSAEIDDNGNVHGVDIVNGIGSGCDEEAVRLIKDVRFSKVKNRGKRLKIRKKFRIEFKLPKQKKVVFNVSTTKEAPKKDDLPKTYSYSIQLNNR